MCAHGHLNIYVLQFVLYLYNFPKLCVINHAVYYD